MKPSLLFAALFLSGSWLAWGGESIKPDIVVAKDGSGDFTTIQAAVASIPSTNRERMIIFVKNGVYHEKVRVDASFVTLRGEGRAATRVEFPQLNDDFSKHPDKLGRAVINVNGNDFVLEDLTAENTAGIIGPHAFTVFGRGDRTVIVDCDVLSHGADTVSLWRGDSGRYYHARCRFEGSVDFVCPRGWCYATDCSFYELKATAAVWHDGRVNEDMKFVMRNCSFNGVEGFNLARHHVDAQFYFINCTFSQTMNDKAPFRVIYPLDGSTPSAADIQKNRNLDKSNLWGERSYFYNCHREGGDYAWFTNNLSSAAGAPTPDRVTAAWTFAGKWNPENIAGPTIRQVNAGNGKSEMTFSESVTVKGKPRLALSGGGFASYLSGSGSDMLSFAVPENSSGAVTSVDLNGGAIIATEADATLRPAVLTLPQ